MEASDSAPGSAAASGADPAGPADSARASSAAASGADPVRPADSGPASSAAASGADPAGPAAPAAPSGGPGTADWHEQRRRAIAGHAAALEAGRAAEAEEAAALIAEFVRAATERGLSPTVLSARSFDGRSTYRTKIRGWYLKSNKSVAVGTDGGYYVLTVPSSLRARISGADLQPSVPRLVVGAGGGDGETIPLAQLLRRRLDLGVSWP